MPQRFDSSTVKLPTHNSPDRRSEYKQQVILAWESIHEKHAEDDNGQCQNNTQYEQIALVNDFHLSPYALLIYRSYTNNWRILRRSTASISFNEQRLWFWLC